MGKKYCQKGIFDEPVMRCDRCEKLLLTEQVTRIGRCTCGNRRFRTLATFNYWEYLKMRYWWKVEPKFFAEFQKGAA